MSRKLLKVIALPLVFLGIFVSLYLIWIVLELPPEKELVSIAKGYFDKYGLVTVFVSAIFEGLLLIGWYFPGTFVVVLALLLAGNNVLQVAEIAALAVAGLVVAYTVNYIVGKYGWYQLFIAFGLREPLEKAKLRLTKYGLSAIFTTYWQINLASLVSTAAGILQFSFFKFLTYSAVAAACWMTFWSSLIFVSGQAALALVNLRFIVLAIIGWIVLRLIFRKRNQASE